MSYVFDLFCSFTEPNCDVEKLEKKLHIFLLSDCIESNLSETLLSKWHLLQAVPSYTKDVSHLESYFRTHDFTYETIKLPYGYKTTITHEGSSSIFYGPTKEISLISTFLKRLVEKNQ